MQKGEVGPHRRRENTTWDMEPVASNRQSSIWTCQCMNKPHRRIAQRRISRRPGFVQQWYSKLSAYRPQILQILISARNLECEVWISFAFTQLDEWKMDHSLQNNFCINLVQSNQDWPTRKAMLLGYYLVLWKATRFLVISWLMQGPATAQKGQSIGCFGYND